MPAKSVQTTAPPPRAESHTHRHRDVAGGWLRPTVFGAMDGLVTNASLIAGVGGGGAGRAALVVTGLAGLVAGAFSMATGEWTSVRTQNHMAAAELALEARELERHPDAETAELATVFRGHGLSPATARAAAEEIAADPRVALRFHAREELGIDPEEMPSPWVAGLSSFGAFAAGALVPLLPLLLGSSALWLALGVAALAAFLGGAVVTRVTGRVWLWSGLQQLAIAAVATGVTYAIGHLVAGAVG